MKKSLWVKCDTKECNYIHYMDNLLEMESFINRRCPHCQQVVLTPKDFKTFKVMYAILRPFNFIGNLLVKLFGLKTKKVDIQVKDYTLNVKENEDKS